MASSNSVLNRVKMFEQKSPSEHVAVASPRQVPSRQSPIYSKQSPTSEPPKRRTELNTSRKISYSPDVQRKGDGKGDKEAGSGRSFTVSPSEQRNSAVTWPSPEVNTPKKMSAGIRPSKFKSPQSKISPGSFSGQKVTSASKPGSLSSTAADSSNKSSTGFMHPSQIKAMHGQKVSPASNSGVLASRIDIQNPKSTSDTDQDTPIHANLKKTQHVSPFGREANRLTSKTKLVSPLDREAKNSPVTGWPSSEDTGEIGMSKDHPVVSRKISPNPASSFSHDENEAPENSAALVRSKAESQQGEMTRTKAAAPQGKMSAKNLTRNLSDASTVMQEERASSIGSAASSLSADELAGIAMRAFRASREEEQRTKVISSKSMALARASPMLQKKYQRRRQLKASANAGQEKSIGKSQLTETKGPSVTKSDANEGQEKSIGKSQSTETKGPSVNKSEANEGQKKAIGKSQLTETKGPSVTKSNENEEQEKSIGKSQLTKTKGPSVTKSNANEGQEKSIGKSQSSGMKGPSGTKLNADEKRTDRTAAIPLEKNATMKNKAHDGLSDTESQQSGSRSSSPVTMNATTVNNPTKKSRTELFAAARQRAASRSSSPVTTTAANATRQRAGSRSPSPVDMTATASNTDKPSGPAGAPPASLPKKDSRLAVLSAGRRRIKASSPAPPLTSEKSLTSEDGSVMSTDDSFSRGQSRAERMARLAAAHRQSPVRKTANETSVSTAPKALSMRKSMSTAKVPGASANTRHIRMSKLASHRSASPLFSPTESKNESTNGKGTQNSSSLPATRADTTAAKAVKSRTPKESSSKSVSARRESFEKSASSPPNGPVKPQKGSPRGPFQPQQASPSGSVKSLQVSPHGSFKPQKVSPHGPFQSQKASSNEPFQPQKAAPHGFQPQKASPSGSAKSQQASPDGPFKPQKASPHGAFQPQMASPIRSVKSQQASTNGPVKPQKASPYGPQKASPHGAFQPQMASPIGSVKSQQASTNGPVKPQKASPYGPQKASPHGAFQPQMASPIGSVKSLQASPNGPVKPQKASPYGQVKPQKSPPNEPIKLHKASPQGERTTTVSAILQGHPSQSGLGSPRRSDNPAALHAKKVASPVRFVETTSPPNRKLKDGVQKPIGRPNDNAFCGKTWSEEKPRQDDASSDISSSHGGVKAAIDAWSSKSKETRQERPALASLRERGEKISPTAIDFSAFDRTTLTQPPDAAPYADSPGSYGARTREDQFTTTRGTKQSEGSRSAFEETKTISSEISVGSSHASTFISSPSSYASSKMSVGAPGPFFRPMETVNDFEETSMDHILLGQLSVESTDDSESPSRLFRSLSNDNSKSGDSDLSFLLEQMQSEDETEDSGIRLLSGKGPPIPKEARFDNNDQVTLSTFSGRYHIQSYSEDSRTIGTTENDKSTLLGQSLLDLNEESRSSDTSDSHVIKWWQNTDPLERRKKFESTLSEKALKPSVAPTNLYGMATTRRDSDDLFSGLSNDDATEIPDPTDSSGDDVFAGMTPSFETVNSSLPPNKNHAALPPPPPAPPLERGDQYGTILLHGSQAIDSVSSDITSSVLADNVSKDQMDWARRESTAVIKEELTAELEAEEETVEEALSEARQKEGSIHTGNSRSAKDSLPDIKEASTLRAGVPLDHDEASGFVPKIQPLKSDSIFMTLGQKILDAFPQCWAPDADGVLEEDSFDLEGAETHSITEDSRSLPQSTMNDYERKVWDEWDKQDSKPGMKDKDPAKKTSVTEVVERYKPEVAEHSPKDVTHPPEDTDRLPAVAERPAAVAERSPEDAELQQGAVERRQNEHRKVIQYAESAKTTTASEDDIDSEPSIEDLTIETEVSKQEAEAACEDPVRTPPSPPRLTLSQRRILEKFSSTMKRHGMEVLKLNRDKKWQTRFLTVSKEVLWVKAGEVNGHSGDKTQCPFGILWMKRFNAAKEYSVSAIDRLGRGGVLCDQLVKVSATGRSNLGHSLSKKQQHMFKDAVAVNLEYSAGGASKSVILLCRTTDAAHFLCTGLRVLMDALKRENASAQQIEL